MPIDIPQGSTGIAADSLRSELIFIGASGTVETVADGNRSFTAIRTPDNPTYWWGNTLHFDGPPVAGDADRWPRLFQAHVESRQPLSSHRTFSWDGTVRGAVDPFVEHGYAYFEVLVLAAEPSTPLTAPHPAGPARFGAIDGPQWDALLELLVDTREPFHTIDGYTPFAQKRIDG